jgi:phosphatidylethanolamine/phosphatidyl-N-methylethanolamine N-methyltransferase
VLLSLSRWLAHPLRMGSVVRSSKILCKHIVCCAWPEDGGVVLELGAGTGAVSRAFLDAGLPAERLVTLEVDPDPANHLRGTPRGVEVLECDACKLLEHLPERFQGRSSSVVCGIPMAVHRLHRLAVARQGTGADGAARGMDRDESITGVFVAVHADLGGPA